MGALGRRFQSFSPDSRNPSYKKASLDSLFLDNYDEIRFHHNPKKNGISIFF
ncbi:Hypothetical protein PMM1842 [Prochlorococcus marinus subsp. pastoris str. CCMP1986]|uniref:Uncharacterized protein n=1 Tax=Prochlorococcus marinus subsp. pastoris (strain CCMP1986 / NIES-2087 / MED4) TaxID=59919 RepID=A8WI55_PROMP|nr:Hypothetical protein PMM1842 [Prochlorococcus marinus subsp. pastoris str. CCMP1986]